MATPIPCAWLNKCIIMIRMGLLLDDFDHTQQVMKGMLVPAIHYPGLQARAAAT
jgi:hypothetical protein